MNRFRDIDGYASDEDQGELLRTILDNKKFSHERPLRIAEIGVYKGRGTCLWNDILLSYRKRGILTNNYDYHAIDHFCGSRGHHDNTNDYYNITLDNLKNILFDVRQDGNTIHIIKNESLLQANIYPDHYFDIVYIDASHEYENVLNDIRAWLPKVNPSGVICGDDYIQGWDGVIQAVNETFDNKFQKIGHQQWLCYL